jgi:hypothetical protein
MRSWGNERQANAALDSQSLANELRSGPVRAMIDRAVRSAAELAGVPFMVLGIRHGQYYEFISTHGIPLSHYIDRVPARLLSAKLFAREVEVADLQKQTQFTALSITPVAKTWRYGGNCPVRIDRALADDGVLALSCADTGRRETGGHILTVLRSHAEFIANLISLSQQIQRPGLVADPATVVASVLQAAVARYRTPICIIDHDRRVVGLSDTFSSTARNLGGARIKIGERLSGTWLSAGVEGAVQNAIDSQEPRQWVPVSTSAANPYFADLFPFSFPDLGKFTILSLHDGRNGRPAKDNVAIARVQDVASDGAARTENPGPLSRFLDETLVRAQKLHRRNDTSYLGVRRWRGTIKAHQIAALQALKSDLPAAFVDAIAAELADAVRAVYGSTDACVVVPVPCGHSGPGCLSHRIAHALGNQLGLDVIDAFAPIAKRKGKSHPRRNAARAAMMLEQKIKHPVILVDDVATSGSHIDEAATLLRQSATSVWPVAWIAP